MTLTVSADGSHLLHDGAFWPLICDTAWSAFADATEAEWIHYLRTRRQQGFTAVAISILPILHDRTVRPDAREPFEVVDGHYDLGRSDESYFATAERFVGLARDHGLHCLLVVLWNNYVTDTWGSRLTPGAVFGDADRSAYLERVTDTFARYDPVFVISGDDSFDAPTAVATYTEALHAVKAAAPHCLTTAHSTPTAVLPDAFCDDPDLDVFVYQSGHGHDQQPLCWELAARYRSRTIRKPVVDLEPPYERHGYGNGLGRWTQAEVRRASWWAVLGGASAGLGYGAHGLWQWHRAGGTFTSPTFSMEPYPWQSALAFDGANDVSLLAALMVDHRLDRLAADQGLLDETAMAAVDLTTPGLRAAKSDDDRLLAIYLPFAREVTVRRSLEGATLTAWDLTARRPIVLRTSAVAGGTKIEQPDVEGDVVVIIDR